MSDQLTEGIYEHLVTASLEAALAKLSNEETELRTLDAADLAVYLTRHVAAAVHRVLTDTKVVTDQIALAHGVLARLAELAPKKDDDAANDTVAEPPQLLEAVYRNAKPPRPASPLSQSTLLTRARKDPALSHELSAEIATADDIDILAAFITVGGVRVIRDALEKAVARGARIRVLTTVFTGTTEVEAVEALAHLPNAEVRISYDVRRTRLHAKAWLFRRRTGLHTAYVGSANLTSTALGSGHEWMVKVCAADLESVIKKFEGTFEGLWNDPEFEGYDKDGTSRVRLSQALKAETKGTPAVLPLFTLRPLPYQLEILDALRAQRENHGRRRNLIVAATGTGKTVIAAFDYARLCDDAAGPRPRLLFVAHRRELLDQALATYRAVLRDASFGELWTDGEVPERWDHVFATIQTAARSVAQRVSADHFEVVVVDECHHAPADSYRSVVDGLRPRILVGLTATPERADGKSLLADFDGRIAAELRLWHALERQLLVPFEYYGVSDGVNLKDVKWSRQGYASADLSGLYTGHHARVDVIVTQLRRRVVDPLAVRALAFCVSVEHAEFMARALTERGIPAIAVHGDSPEELRRTAPERLRAREVNVVCTCDLYNEGVDLPFVDTLLLLRPTSSATLFMQQIGRGLRLHPKKASCLVLDFIGQHRSEFRFDGLYAALTGIPQPKLAKAVQGGFPFLPSGCAMHLDGVVAKQVLDALKRAVATAKAMAGELRDLTSQTGENVTLARYLEASGRDLEDVYEKAEGWTALRAAAGLEYDVSDDELDLSRRLGWLAHVDEASRLRHWSSPPDVRALSVADQRRITMTEFQLVHRGVLREPVDAAAWLYGSGRIRRELGELAEVLQERVSLAAEHYPVPEWPLALHRRYGRREIVAAVGFVRPGEKGKIPQGGILKLEGQRELLLVTLDKSGASFSPTTRYKDYAISPSLFHWETQSAASVFKESGKRYIESPKNGWSFYLFVRPDEEAPYAFLGPVRYRSHEGNAPIGITWELEHAVPGGLYDQFATLTQG